MVASALRCSTQDLSFAGYRLLRCTGSVVGVPGFSCSIACRILVPLPGIKPVSPTWQGIFLNHWTTREVPYSLFSNISERQSSEMTLQSGRQGQFRIRGFSPQFCQDVLCSMCLLQRASGWAAKYLGRWLVSHFHHPGSTVCSVFPLKMWFLSRSRCIGTHGPSEDKSLRIQLQSPGEASLLGRSQAQISGQRFLMLEQVFLSLLNLFSSLYTSSSLTDVRRGRHMLLWSKHFFDEGELSARLNY